ncbi:MAG: hypothetical protein RBJ76_13245 [Stenomitos frigidus ULC029]
MHPLGYYVSTSQTDDLQEQFGTNLQNLPLAEKLHLLGVLAIHQQVVTQEPDDEYVLADALDEHPFEDTGAGNIELCLDTLEGESDQTIRAFMVALAAYIAGA